jgi:hypothetical protein
MLKLSRAERALFMTLLMACATSAAAQQQPYPNKDANIKIEQ